MSDAMTREQFEYDVETVFAQSNLITKDRFLAHDTALRQEIERLTADVKKERDRSEALGECCNRAAKTIEHMPQRLAQAEQDRDRLRTALESAIRLIESEYCSHDESHGADTPQCYAREFYKALRGRAQG